MSTFLLIGGVVLMLIGGIKLLIEAFSESLLWGFACLILPIVSLIFVATHWRESRSAVVLQIVGLGMFFWAGHLGAQ